MSLPARSTSTSVSAPRPGPISSTVSEPVRCSASAMRPRMRRSVRKCWPRLFRVGGKPPRPPRGGEEPGDSSRIDRSALEDEEGQVVATGCVARVLVEEGEDAAGDLRGGLVAMLAHDI